MADNVQGFNHLDAVLNNLGNSLRQDAIKELMMRSKMKEPGIEKDPNAMAEVAREKLEMGMGDRAEAVYSQMYDNIVKQNPGLHPSQVDAMVRARMTPDAMLKINKYYGSKTPYNLPKNTSAGFLNPNAPTTTATDSDVSGGN